MKKLIKLITVIAVVLTVIGGNINSTSAAGSLSITGNSSVAANGTVSVSIAVSGGLGFVNVSVTGGTITDTSSSSDTTMNGTTGATLSLDSKSVTLTIKAGSSGSVVVTATATDFVSDDLVSQSLGTKTKTISITTSSSGSSGSGSSSGSSSSGSSSSGSSGTTTVSKSSDNTLNSLSIEGVDLTPDFASSVVSYSGSVKDVDSITIKATANHEDATVSGTGSKDLKLGYNEFKVVCTAENGSTKTYLVTIFKDESPTEFIETEDEATYGVVKYYQVADIPDGFEETTVRIDGEQVVAWKNTTIGVTIVYLVDEEGNEGFYAYDDGVISSFSQITLLGVKLYEIEIEDTQRDGLIYQEVIADGNTLMGWAFEDAAFANYYVVELMDEFGNTVTYLYDIVLNLMVTYPEDMYPISAKSYQEQLVLVEDTGSTNFMIASGVAIVTSISTVGLGILYYIKFKKVTG